MLSTIPTFTLTTLGVLNLLLLVGIARRVNRLADRAEHPAGDEPPLPSVGDRVTGFTAMTTDGDRIHTGDLTGRTLVGFFAAGCPPCELLLPHFLSFAADFSGGRRQVLAIVIGKNENPAELVDRINGVARVIVERGRGPALTAFGVDAFPAVCLVEDGTIVAVNFERDIAHRRDYAPST
jgi:thiol-disulfide isomerase/thioredoxin